MSVEAQAAPAAENKANDKEFNFRQLEAKYKNEIERERQARVDLEQKVQELSEKHTQDPDEDDQSDPYVDHRKLEKKLAKFGQMTQTDIQRAMEMAKNSAKDEIKQEIWLESNPDFFDVLQHADKFADANPLLAETILKMPDNFERKKLVYANIKAMNLHKPPQKQSSIQEQIDSNRKNVFYQPSGIANAPFTPQGDFSTEGQKNSYKKMKEAQARLRLG
jgi:hypothetical protein